MKIKDIMSKKLVTCNTYDNILFVSNLMKINDVGFILIMNEKKLYGVITDRDIVCDLADGNKEIKEFAHTNIISIEEDKDINVALEIMREHKIKRLVVTNNKNITGVLSLSDIYNTNISSDEILDTLRVIYAINRNDEDFDADVSDFIL